MYRYLEKVPAWEDDMGLGEGGRGRLLRYLEQVPLY